MYGGGQTYAFGTGENYANGDAMAAVEHNEVSPPGERWMYGAVWQDRRIHS